MADPKLLLTEAQTVGVFGSADVYRPSSFPGEAFDAVVTPDVGLRFTGTTLGVEAAGELNGCNVYRILGNTLVKSKVDPRGCDVAGVQCEIDACGLGDLRMSDETRRDLNCSGANTVRGLGDNPKYVITPTNNEVVFLSDAGSHTLFTASDEHGREQTMFGKVRAASTLVISEHDLPDGVEEVDGILNGADSSLAVTLWEFKRPGAETGTRYAMVSCSSQPNLGDRDYDAQIVAKGVNGILDREGVTDPAERAEILANAEVEIHIGFSATLQNFAHRVMIPRLTVPEELAGVNLATLTTDQLKLFKGPAKDAITILRRNNLIDPETGEVSPILPKHVMEYRYPGSLDNGEVHPGSNIEHGIYDEPYRDGGCPDDGGLCHIDYMGITQRTLVGQLVGVGMNPDNIRYDNSRSVDTGNTDNHLASRRLFALQDVPANRTPRSANGVTISFKNRTTERPARRPDETAIAAAAELLLRFPDTADGDAAWAAYQDERWGADTRPR